MASSTKKLRSGYTTGACAAAAAKAATIQLLRGEAGKHGSTEVEIPFPDGSRHAFSVSYSSMLNAGRAEAPRPCAACASVIKDAGDDPDVTNGAEIVATAAFTENCGGVEGDSTHGNDLSACKLAGLQACRLIIKGGRGVGTVTKPGLAVPVGEPAINPVPRKMIREAVSEAIAEYGAGRTASSGLRSPVSDRCLVITISVPKGEELAKKTLNARLGIVGGISILGTSGIVRPLSTEAWTSSITASMDVAKAAGIEEIVLSVGRVSERAHMKKYGFPEEAYVMMGDYFEFSLSDAKRHGFRNIHISAHWAKMLKISLSTPQTHVRHGAIDIRKGVAHLNSLGIGVPEDREFNTARQIYDYLTAVCGRCLPEFRRVCAAAKRYAEGITAGIPVIAHLVSYDGDIIVDSE